MFGFRLRVTIRVGRNNNKVIVGIIYFTNAGKNKWDL